MSHWNNAAFRAALMGSVAAVVMVAQPAAAQTKTFNIPAQDAASAIPAFVKQSGLQVLATATDLQGVRTNAVSGSLSNDAALAQLIANTGLTVKTNDGASAVIVRAAAADAVASEAAAEAPADPQEVVVVGVRKSLRDALDVKRRNTGIVEAISSKDIGALPDVTIAETLNRLPGITATRDRGNDSQASIRGLGARMVLGTVNGREVASSEPDRNVRWEVYPSEVVSGASVYKSSEARLISGGISGTVDLQTIHPLDYKGPSFVLRAGPVYYDGGSAFPNYDGLGYRTSASFVHRFSNSFAAVLGLTSQVQKNGYESVQGWGYNSGADNGPVVAGDTTKYNTPWGAQAEAKRLKESRFGASLGLQFKPTDNFQLSYDLLYSDIKIHELQDQAWYGDGAWGNWDGGNYSNYTDGATASGQAPVINSNGDVVAASVAWAGDKSVVARYTEDKTLIVQGLNGKWTSEHWTVSADASYSKAQRYNLWAANELAYWPSLMTYDFRDKPVITVSSAPEDNTQTAQTGQTSLGAVTDELSAVHLDFERHLDSGLFKSILFGVRASDRTKALGSLNGTVSPIIGAVPDYLLSGYSFKNFNIPTILTGDFGALATHLYGTSFDIDPKTTPITDRVKEKVSEAYLEGTYATTIGGIPVDGNIGVRVVDVDATSSGTSTVAGNWVESPPGSGVWVQEMVTTPVTGGASYSKVLPSATARLDFGNGQYLKLSAAKVISRPPLNDMIITRQISSSAPYTGSSGNPYLKPFEATQLDISYENYFNKDALFAVSVYHKQVDNFVGYASRQETIDGNVYTLTSPVNSTKGGRIDGVELTYQSSFGFIGLDHFGIYSNYAYVDSDLTEMSAGLPLNGLAKNTGTLDFWYSDHGIDARLGTKYHDTYTAIYGWNDAQLIRVRPETTMDFSISYQINPIVQVRFQANNLLDTPLRTYNDNVKDRLGRYDLYGKRYLLDFTVKY
ncbi:TonB-dependent receptor [Asticcacaulis sp.]|uniref:TonB-dependent receptor n=1 Tax=Asticcacaulis sp. TaxID=1872648 RepID=UPI003F7B611A